MTLYSVMQLNLLPNGKHAASNGHTPIVQFFYNLQILANSDKEQAAILFGMLFSLIVWVVSALGLMVACLIYITFLWHHIPSIDGGLSGFCKRKIDSRLQKIVGIKIEEALANEDRAAFKKESKIGDRLNPIKRQPTIPLLTPEGDDALLSMPTLLRQTTQSALPPYTSSDSLPNLSHQPTLPDLSRKGSSRPAFPYRSETQSSAFSNMSYMSDAPLIDAAVPMGYVSSGRSYSPGPPSRNFSRTSTTNGRPRIDLSMTRTSQESQLSLRNPSYSSSVGRGAAGIPNRQNTGTSDYFSSTHLSNHGPPRANSQGGKTPQQVSPIDTLGRHTPRWGTDRQTPVQEYEMHSQPLSRSETYYQAYNPNMTTTSTGHISTHTSSARNFSAPSRQLSNEYFPSQPPPPQRSGTAPLPQIARYADYNQLPYEVGTGQGMPRPTVPPRAATAIPGQSAWNHNQNKPRRYQ
ncbi:hypothetical protein MMC14_005393 [Varicellaria rhodocarpa]|nr:hypothetical protein [Varicellaria rhodocarpa]